MNSDNGDKGEVEMHNVSIYRVQLVKKENVRFENAIIKSPDDAVDVARKFLEQQTGEIPDREWFCGLWLNTKNKVTGIEVISIGSINSAIVHPREAFKGAILHNAASVIYFHNHPSGDPTPSPEDIEVTKRLTECGQLLGMEVLDSLILGDPIAYSIKKMGLV